MSSLQFQYEIPLDEYVAAQTLYYRSLDRTRHIGRAARWLIAGVGLVVIASNSSSLSWAPNDSWTSWSVVLLAAIGIWWSYAGIRMLFPARHFRRAYRSFQFAGKSFKADMDENEFRIAGEFIEWRVKWPAVQTKSENERVFIFVAGGTIFIFGKKFLSSDQQQELRKLADCSRSASSVRTVDSSLRSE